MDRFTRLTQEKVASAMSLTYGDQGPLSLAQVVQPLAGAAAAAIPVKFVAPALPAPKPVEETGPAGSGLCLIDADGDGAIDYWQMTPAGARLMRNDGKGAFVGASQLATSAPPVTCVVGDYDNDEKPDVAIGSAAGVSLFRNTGAGAFDGAAPLVVLKNGPGLTLLGLSFVDVDHDADLDLVVSRGRQSEDVPADASPVLLRNNGDGTFADVTAERGLTGLKTAGITASDLNNDRAIDLIFTGPTATILLNPREGAYKRTRRVHAGEAVQRTRRRRVRLRQGRLDGPGFHALRSAGVAVAQRRGQVLQEGLAAGVGALQRLRAHGDRLRQRRLDRPGGRRLRAAQRDGVAGAAERRGAIRGRLEQRRRGPADHVQRPARTGGRGSR